MAKYEDYVKKQEEQLNEEITEAGTQQEDRQTREPDNSFQMPERFAGKSPEEIAQSYLALEREHSRQGNVVGELRKALDDSIALELDRRTQTEEPQKQVEPITLDDLYDDPNAAVSKAVDQRVTETDKRIEALEQQLAAERQAAQQRALEGEYSGWEQEVQTPEFAEWVQGSQYRMRVAARAGEGDTEAVEELVSGWYETKTADTSAQQQAQRDAALNAASSEAPGTSGTATNEDVVFSRAQLTNIRVAAARGDAEATAWLAQNREAIAVAYEEGHITD